MTFLCLAFFKLVIFYLAGRMFICLFWHHTLLFTAALLVGILPVLSQVWDLSVYFTFLLFLNCCFKNKSSEVESCGEMELKSLISRVLADRYLFEICHENPILNLSVGPCVYYYYYYFYDSFPNWAKKGMFKLFA